MTLDKQRKKTLSQLIEIENETKDLHLGASIAASKLAAMIDEYELEKKRLSREKPVNIDFLLDEHNQGIKRCESGLGDLEKAKASLKGLLEEIGISKRDTRRLEKDTADLMFQIERLRVKFEEIAWNIASCKEILRIGR